MLQLVEILVSLYKH